MDYELICHMAEAGYVFAPTDAGMTRSNRTGWPNLATSNSFTIKEWLTSGDSLVSVAKRGHQYIIDIDDPTLAVERGFKMEWLDGTYLVDTPSGGLHASALADDVSDALPFTSMNVRAEKNSPKAKLIVELKLHHATTAAPSAERFGLPNKKDGFYQTRSPFTAVRKGIHPDLLEWIKANMDDKIPSQSRGRFAGFHPDFELEEFLGNEGCSEYDSDTVDGAFHVAVDECPHCGKSAVKSTVRAQPCKFIFGGSSVGFICHACGIATFQEHVEEMERNDSAYERWAGYIYRVDDPEILAVVFPVEQLVDDGEPETSSSEGFSLEQQDTGNGERLVKNFGHLIRWVVETGEWMVWGKNGWRPDTKGTLMRLSKKVVEGLESEAKAAMAAARDDEDLQKEARALMRHARNSGSVPRRRAMIESAGYEKPVTTNFNDWDSDGWLFNCKNGVIDLNKQTFRNRKREDLCMKQSPVAYDASATCPVWEAAMDKWMCGDKELVTYLQAALGVTLTSDTSLQALFFNQGGGANGKDTMFTGFEYVMGDYWRNVDFMTLAETKNHSEHRNDLAVLAGAVRMVTAAESSDGHTLDEGVIKQVTGCSPVTCRHIHGKPFTYIPQYKLWLMSNYEPVIKGSDWGIWRRVKKIPWNYTITEAEKDKTLPEKLKAEASGILNWALAGLKMYIENGYRLPACKAVEDATAKYRKDMDIIGRFAEECVCFKPTAITMGSEIYKAYYSWCRDNGTLSMSSRRFYSEWQKRYPQLTKRDVSRGALFEGVGLLTDGKYMDAEMIG